MSLPPNSVGEKCIMGLGRDYAAARYIDMWAMPGVHPSNIEFLQQLKTADTNHFTTHMDCVGTISEQDPDSRSWKKSHLIGIRTDVWKPSNQELQRTLKSLQADRRKELKREIKRSGRLSEKQRRELEERASSDEIMNLKAADLVTRRLIIKLFKTTGTRTRWVGTLEQITTSEIHNSLGSRRPLLSFAVMLPRTQMLTQLQQNHRTLRIPSVFSGCYSDDGTLWNLLLKKRWIALGAHFDLYADGQNIGEIDSRVLTFGADCTLRLRDHELTEDTGFVNVMTLFAASVGYHKAMYRSLRRRIKSTLAGESYRHVVEDEELRLRHNGRSAA
ncbi:MAG: hypothetical protein AAGG44_15600 [Planctomycetota bacterium]